MQISLHNICGYQGESEYRVRGGSLDGCRITITPLKPQHYEKIFSAANDEPRYRNDPEALRRKQAEAMLLAGTVRIYGRGEGLTREVAILARQILETYRASLEITGLLEMAATELKAAHWNWTRSVWEIIAIDDLPSEGAIAKAA